MSRMSVRRQRAAYIASDFVTLSVGWFIFNIVRYYSLPPEMNITLASMMLHDPIILTGQVLFPLMMVGLYWLSGYYNKVFFKSRLDEIANTLFISLTGTLIIYFVALIDDPFAERLRNYELMAILFGLLAVPCYVMRLIITCRAARRIQRREIAYNTLVVGTTRGAVKLASKLDSMPKSMGFNILGYVVDDEGAHVADHNDFDRPVYTLDQLESAAGSLDIKRLIVVPHRNGFRETISLISRLFPLGMEVYITPDLYHLIAGHPRLSTVVGEPLINISTAEVPASTTNIKRLFDVVISAIALVVLSPVLVAIAVAVKRDSSGPVIYRQERIGYRKRKFFINKFRTMNVDAESGGPALSSVNDPRITRTGRFLRKYRLDELPQFWNVLIGEMSLVGPRPEREYYVRQLEQRAPYYSLIHQVRPGITSWGMVKYGYASNVDQMIERLRYDLLYIENVSLTVDLKILFYTVNTVLTGRGI